MGRSVVIGILVLIAPSTAKAEDSRHGTEVAATFGLGLLWGTPVCQIVSDEESCSGIAAATFDLAATVRLLPWLGVGVRGSYGALTSTVGRRDSSGGGYDMAKHPGRWLGEARFYLPSTIGWDGWVAAEAGMAHVTRTVEATGTVPLGSTAPAPGTTWGPAVGASVGASVSIFGPVIGGFHLGADKVWLARRHTATSGDGVVDYGNPVWISFGIEAGILLPL